MRTITEILWVEEWTKDGKKHSRTHVQLEDGEIAAGYSKDFKVGDLVMCFYDPAHDTIKVSKPKKPLDITNA